MRRPVLGTLFALACVSILTPVPANAIPIHKHVTTYSTAYVPDAQGYRDRVRIPHEKVIVYDVAPPDSDDDGCPDSNDSYDGPGCNPPLPPPAPASVAPVAPVQAALAPVSPAYSGGCPSYMAAEATSPTAVNPTTGASGCYQVLPSTAAAMGAACSDVNSSTCVGAICAAQGNEAWASSGATPCG